MAGKDDKAPGVEAGLAALARSGELIGHVAFFLADENGGSVLYVGDAGATPTVAMLVLWAHNWTASETRPHMTAVYQRWFEFRTAMDELIEGRYGRNNEIKYFPPALDEHVADFQDEAKWKLYSCTMNDAVHRVPDLPARLVAL